jgi:endonuclease/exonuclease/phosphatase (EEP) superfamily protein YafD
VRLLRIDHILVRGFVATETRVLPIRGSDHSALFAELVPGDV